MLLVMDKFKGPTGFSQLLKQGAIGDRMAALARLRRLTTQVQAELTVPWRDQVRVGSMQKGTLTLVMDDRAFITQTRFLSDALVQALAGRAEFQGIKRVKWTLSRSWQAPPHHAEQLKLDGEDDIDEILERMLQRSKDG